MSDVPVSDEVAVHELNRLVDRIVRVVRCEERPVAVRLYVDGGALKPVRLIEDEQKLQEILESDCESWSIKAIEVVAILRPDGVHEGEAS